MKKFVIILVLVALTVTASNAIAGKAKFPDKGWHRGFYALAMGGMIQATNDRNVDTGRKFGSSFDPGVGLTLGWDITDWIGPMLSFKYGFDTAQVGNGTVAHPTQNAREHLINAELSARFSPLALIKWKNLSDTIKMLPYVKAGFAASGLYINASADANKAGSWGYGPSVGAGVEFLVWEKLWFGFDLQENLLFLQGVKKTVNGVANTTIIQGGFHSQFSLMGVVGYHY